MQCKLRVVDEHGINGSRTTLVAGNGKIDEAAAGNDGVGERGINNTNN